MSRPPLLPAPAGPLPVPVGGHPLPVPPVVLLPAPDGVDPRQRLREALRRAAHGTATEAYDLPASAWRGRLVDVVT